MARTARHPHGAELQSQRYPTRDDVRSARLHLESSNSSDPFPWNARADLIHRVNEARSGGPDSATVAMAPAVA